MTVGLGLGITAASHFVVTAAAEVIRAQVGVSGTGNISTTQSKFGGASYFVDDANSEFFSTDNSATQLGTGDFTLEFWIYRTEDQEFDIIADHRDTTDDDAVALVYSSASDVVYLFINNAQRTTSTSDVPVNTWTHIAVVRSSGSISLYINGTSEGTPYANSNNFSTTNGWRFSGNILTGTSLTTAYYDEVRVSDIARYTTNFTPSTTPFVNDEDTLLLLHMDGTDGSTYFEDDNGTGRARVGVSANGNAQIDTAQSKFGGASALFDGSGDYLLTESSTFILGSGDWTIEFWFRPASVSITQILLDFRPNTTQGFYPTIYMVNQALYFYTNSGNRITYASATPAVGTWYHIAVSKSGNDHKMFFDGTQVGSTYTAANTYSGTRVVIGADSYAVGTSGTNGHIDEFRISDTARYTTNFTPPTAPFVNDENTLLLLHMDGTDGSTVFTDDNGSRTKIGVTAVGNAQVDTAQSKFGGASALFDGTGDYLKAAPGIFNWGSGDFTLEFYARIDSLASNRNFFDFRSTGGNHLAFSVITTGVLRLYDGAGATVYDGTTVLSTNTWYHIAVTRSSGTMKYWLDGVEEGSWTNTRSHSSTGALFIGANYSGGDAMDGYIDEVRVSNIARYTTGFTPSTTAFVNDSNTLLLLHMDGTDGSTTFTDDNS